MGTATETCHYIIAGYEIDPRRQMPVNLLAIVRENSIEGAVRSALEISPGMTPTAAFHRIVDGDRKECKPVALPPADSTMPANEELGHA